MEVFLLVVLLILVIISNNRFSALKEIIHTQNTVIAQLRQDVLAFQQELRTLFPPSASIEPKSRPLAEQLLVADPPAAPAFPVQASPVPSPEMPVQTAAPEPESGIPTAPATVQEIIPEPEPFQSPSIDPPRPSFIQRFLAENPDLEKFIGENLINKIGIAILVAGIGYFVKFAIDQHWINEIGRVLIGILAGGLLLGLAHRLRYTFSAFSSVLVAGGLSVLYFTIAIAFSDYKIFSQPVAFMLMVIITGFAVLLSIAYNRPALAVMSLLGGFATPFMVSSGHGNYVVLFTYLLILDGGMLVLAYFKRWPIVHFVAYGFTVLIYGLWLNADVINVPNAPSVGALGFATAFYGLFMAMNLIYNLKAGTRFKAVDISLLISNTAFYYSAGMLILHAVAQEAYQGLFTAGMAVLNFGIATALYRRAVVDRTLLYLQIGLVITFASLTVPVQLDGNFITMFWALEAVLLLWLAQRSGLALLATGSVLITALMLISLQMDWATLYLNSPQQVLPILINKAFITSLIAIASLAGTYRLLPQQTSPIRFWIGELPVAMYQRLIGYLFVLVAYAAGLFELDYQAVQTVGFGDNRLLLQEAYHLVVAVLLLLAARRTQQRSFMLQTSFFGLFILILVITYFDSAIHDLLASYFMGDEVSLAGFWIHYLSLFSLLGVLYLLNFLRSSLAPLPPLVEKAWPWFMGCMLVYTASSELFSHLVYWHIPATGITAESALKTASAAYYTDLIIQINKVGLPILWGICAFAFMYLGLNQRNRPFRIMSLSLFALTLVKLFIYDLRGISEGGRIAAFISLGILLLIISFMYQRLKRLILDTDTPPIPAEAE